MVDRAAVTPAALLQRAAQGGSLARNLRAQLSAWLASPWACAAEDDRAARVRAQWGLDAPTPQLGEVLLLAYQHGRGALFSLRERGSYSFGARAKAAARVAFAVAKRCAPTMANARIEALADVRAEYVYSDEGRHELLDGSSFGLAFVLADASRFCGHAVPAHVCATAVVHEDGALSAVEGLRAKLTAVSEAALSVTDVLVARDQHEEAASICAALARPLRVHSFATAEAAVSFVFASVADLPPPAWSSHTERDRAFAALDRFVMNGEPLADWTRAVRPARWLLQQMPTDPRAQLVLAIAQRHAGEPSIPIAWDESLFDDLGLAYVAQVVQSAADAGDDRTLEYANRALWLADRAPAEPGALFARGAAARALGCLREYERAAFECERAVQRWARRGEPEQGSRPLCEWLRVTSIRGDRAAFDRACAHRDGYARASSPSLAYIDLALCAGRVRLAQPTAALAIAEQHAGTHDVQSYVATSMDRWRARAMASLGRRDDAQRVRAALLAREPGCIEAEWCALDRAIEAGDRAAIEGAHRAVLARCPQGTKWLDVGADLVDRARTLADEGPY